jgi:hypothetical protein
MQHDGVGLDVKRRNDPSHHHPRTTMTLRWFETAPMTI